MTQDTYCVQNNKQHPTSLLYNKASIQRSNTTPAEVLHTMAGISSAVSINDYTAEYHCQATAQLPEYYTQ